MNWDDWRIFCAAAQSRTLSAAAQRLDTSIATVARRIDGLEAALGFRLFDRAAHGVALTAQGRALFERASGAASAIDDVSRLAAALRTSQWSVAVRVSATEPFISDILAPALPKLFAVAPEIRIDLSATTDVVSLAAREADIAVRFARPVGDSLIVRKLPAIDLRLFAAKSYLAGRRPAALDLRRERLLGFDSNYGRIVEVAWLEECGLDSAVVVHTSSMRALINATAAGAGVALLPRMLVHGIPGLVEVPAPRPIPRRPIWLVTHRDLRRARPQQIVRDWIIDAFRAAQPSS